MATQGMSAITSLSNTLTKAFGFAFKLRIMFFFMLFLIINAAIISYEHKDVKVGLSDLGERFLTPTLKLQQTSQQIIDRKGFSDEGVGGVKHWWDVIWGLWGMFSQFYVILMWLSVLGKLITVFPLTESQTVLATIIAIPIFLVLQMIYIAITKQGDFLQPWTAFITFLKSLPYVFKPITKIADKFVGGNQTKMTGVIH